METKLKLNDYTGFTTKCKACNEDIKSKYIGKNYNGTPSYILFCKCVPLNITCPMCNGKLGNRKKIDVTENNNMLILVDQCHTCKSIVPVENTGILEWKLIDKWNKRMYKKYEGN